MKKSKLAIEQARSNMVAVLGNLKHAATFREVDAIKGDDNVRDALRRTSTAGTVVAEHAIDARHQAEAIRRAAELRLAALLAPMTPVEVKETAEREGVTNAVKAQKLALTGRLPARTIKAAEHSVHEHNRQSKVRPEHYSELVPLTPAQRMQAIAKLADVPTMREAVAAVCPPTFVPKAPVIAAKPTDIAPKALRDYQVCVLAVVAEALKLRGLVEGAIKVPADAVARRKVQVQHAKMLAAVDEMESCTWIGVTARSQGAG